MQAITELGFRAHLETEGLEPTRESRHTQPIELQFRTRLTEDGAWPGSYPAEGGFEMFL